MKKYHHCVKFTYPLSFQTRIPKVDQHTDVKLLRMLNYLCWITLKSTGTSVAEVPAKFIERLKNLNNNLETGFVRVEWCFIRHWNEFMYLADRVITALVNREHVG